MALARIFAAVMLLAANAASAQAPAPPVLVNPDQPGSTQCSDGIDNDGDGKVDFNATLTAGDDGCWDPSDNEERAGVPAGIAMSTSGNCGSPTLAGNTTYTGCDWASKWQYLRLDGNNITIRNSRIGGPIFSNGSSSGYSSSLVIEDSDLVGPADLSATHEVKGTFVMRRVRCRLFPQCWYTNAGTVEDSVAYDGWAQGSDCHTEPLMISSTGSFAMRRTRVLAKFHSSELCTGGGYTAVITVAGGGVWGAAQNKLFEYNRIEAGQSMSACMYGGSADPATQNIDIQNNVFAGLCGNGVTYMINSSTSRPGSTWIGNVKGNSLATGTPIPAP